jgi:hypothetical protein
MSIVAPGYTSTFRFCELLTDEDADVQHFSDPVPFTYRDRPDTITHVIDDGDTWESIAATYYRSLPNAPQLWRIIAEFQPVIPLDATLPPVGPVVYVPSVRTVLEEIFSESRRPDYEA